MKLAIELSDQQADRLREEATRLGVEPEQLALAALADLIAREGSEFDSAAQGVLSGVRQSVYLGGGGGSSANWTLDTEC